MTENSFIERFREIVEPLALSSNLDIGLRFNEEETWIFKRDDPESQEQFTDPGNPASGKQTKYISLIHPPEGILVLSSDQKDEDLIQGLIRIASSIHHQLEMEADQMALLDELSLSWESLEAVQEIGWKLRANQNRDVLLEGIMTRTAAFQSGLCSILWQQVGNRFQVIMAKGITVAENLKPGKLVLKAIAKGNGIIINGRDQVLNSDPDNSYAESAQSVVVAPIITPHGLSGALEVWSNNESSNFDSRTMRLIETLALQAAMVIENDQLYEKALGNARLQKELEIGSRIQQTLLIGRPPKKIQGLKISAMTVASRYIDGDFYDFIDHDGRFLDVIVGDVMGKGVPAALLAAATKQQFLEAFAKFKPVKNRNQLLRIDDVVTWVNHELSDRLSILDWFTTLCYMRFDLMQRRVEFVDAGHPKTLHYQFRDSTCTELKGNNLPLGLSESERYYLHETRFNSGDYFFLYSDGVTETEGIDGELYGEERLSGFLKENHSLLPEHLIENLKRELIGFSGADLFVDDLTCVAVRID